MPFLLYPLLIIGIANGKEFAISGRKKREKSVDKREKVW